MTLLPMRRGVVLATALYYLAVLGLLVVGTLYAARGAHAGADHARHDATLTAATDLALAAVVTRWSSPERARQPVGSTWPTDTEAPPGARTTASITRLGPALFVAEAEAALIGDSGTRRGATLLLRLLVAQPMLEQPMVSRGDVELGADARIVTDFSTALDCPARASAALAMAPDASLIVNGARVASDSFGVARVDEAGSASVWEQFGAETWTSLAARADIVLPPGAVVRPALATHDSCVVTRAPDDWSDRTAADGCVVPPPIVLAEGDLTIESGEGTGILLVAGRLRITGSFVFTGVIVARDGVESTGDGVDLAGSVLAGRLTTVTGTTSGTSLRLSGRAALHASRCAAYRVFAMRAGVRSVRARAWSERFR